MAELKQADQSGLAKPRPGLRNRIATAARGQSILRAHPFISEVERKDHAYGQWQFDRLSWHLGGLFAGGGQRLLRRRRIFDGRGASQPRTAAWRRGKYSRRGPRSTAVP